MAQPATRRRRIGVGAALACAVLSAAVVAAWGGARRRRVELRHGVVRVHPAIYTWTAVSRSLGIAALVILVVTLVVGLFYGRRLVTGPRRAELRALHMTLSLSAVTVIALHIVTLLGASGLRPSISRLVVPGLWPYRGIATALGVLSAYAIGVLGPTYSRAEWSGGCAGASRTGSSRAV